MLSPIRSFGGKIMWMVWTTEIKTHLTGFLLFDYLTLLQRKI